MGINIPGEQIPDSTNLLDGFYDFKVESMEPVTTQTGKLAIKVAMRVQSPKKCKGLTHYEQFTIGSNDDPEAREPETWGQSFGAISLKKLCKKAGVAFAGALEHVAAEMQGRAVSGKVVYTVQPKYNKDGTENPYAGNARSQVKDWYEVGEQTPRLEGGKADAPAVKAAPKVVKAPPPPADDDEDEEDEAPKARSKSSKSVAAKRPAVDEDDEDDDE